MRREPAEAGHGESSAGFDEILGNGTAYDLIPVPWSWVYMCNYNSRGLPGTSSASFTGADKFKVEFLTAPNVSATIIIYDRQRRPLS